MSFIQPSDLLVQDTPEHVGQNDTRLFSFDAEQAITSATATMVALPRRDDVSALITNTTVSTPNVVVTVTNFVFGTFYELSVTFTNAASEEWTRTLVIYCAG